MAQQTKTAPRTQTQTPPPAESKGQVAVIAPPRMLPPASEVMKQYDITIDGWRTLVEAIFPAAKTPAAVMMALEYCARRKLDIFKHPVHIVPIWNSQANNGKGGYVETVWPGIAELRTTAARTKEYAGMDAPVFGPTRKETFKARVKKWENGQQYWEDEEATVEFPAWCQITVYRLMAGNRVPFPGPRVHWLETYATKGKFSEIPNEMWQKRPHGQLEKCSEAAALRRAFPEELGNDYAIDEIGAFHTHEARDVTDEGQATIDAPAEEPKREQYQKNGNGKSADSPPADEGAAQTDGPGGGAVTTGDGDSKPEAAARSPSSSKVTDVEPDDRQDTAGQKEPGDKTDLEDDDETSPPEDEPVVFEEYKRIGDFFNFADPWVDDPARTEAELVAFGAFYYHYMRERMDPSWKSPAVREAMADTHAKYQEALKRVGQKKQSQ